jgi:hypothetical protein
MTSDHRVTPSLVHDILAYVKAGRRRLITRQHLNQFLGITS